MKHLDIACEVHTGYTSTHTRLYQFYARGAQDAQYRDAQDGDDGDDGDDAEDGGDGKDAWAEIIHSDGGILAEYYTVEEANTTLATPNLKVEI